MKRVLYSALVIGLIAGNAYCSKDKKEAEEETEFNFYKADFYGEMTHFRNLSDDSSPKTTLNPAQRETPDLGTPHGSLNSTPEEGASPQALAQEINRPPAPLVIYYPQDQEQTGLVASAAIAVAVQPVIASGANSVHSTAPLKKHKRASSAPAKLDQKGGGNEIKKATRQAHAKSAAEKAQEKTQE